MRKLLLTVVVHLFISVALAVLAAYLAWQILPCMITLYVVEPLVLIVYWGILVWKWKGK